MALPRYKGRPGEEHIVKAIQEQYVSSEIDRKAEKIKANLKKKVKIQEKDGSGVTEAMFEGLMDNLFMKFRSEVSDMYGIDVRRGEAEEDPEEVIRNVSQGKKYSKVDGRLINADQKEPKYNKKRGKKQPVDLDSLISGKSKNTSIVCRLVSRNKRYEVITARKEVLEGIGGGHLYLK